MSHRPLAALHLKAAKRQLEQSTDETLRYACLDLRMAIECLTYDLLALYRNDVLDETLAEWRADKILAALKAIDPAADASPMFQMANDAGEFDGEDTLTLKERRFETKWAKKAYNTLGRYLHERTFIELENGKEDEWPNVRDRANAIADELQEIMDSTGWNLRFQRTFSFPCDCGETASYKMGPWQLRSRATCPTCNANYEVIRERPDAATVQAKLISGAA